jgi:hypothetical protein
LRLSIRSFRVVSKVYLSRSLSLNLPVCDIQVQCTWHSALDNERCGARMLINSHHAKMLFGMPSWNVRTLRNSVWYSGRSMLRCVGGERLYITSSCNQGDATMIHRIVRSQSPVGVVGCVLICACLDAISWCLGIARCPHFDEVSPLFIRVVTLDLK